MHLSRLPAPFSKKERKKGRKPMADCVVVVGLLTRPKSAGNCEFQRVHVSAKVAEQKLKLRRNPGFSPSSS